MGTMKAHSPYPQVAYHTSEDSRTSWVISLVLHGVMILSLAIMIFLPAGGSGGSGSPADVADMEAYDPEAPVWLPEEEPEVEPTPPPVATPEVESIPDRRSTPEPEPEPEAGKVITTEEKPKATPKPTSTPKPKATSTPKPTATPKPTGTPKPTATPKPSATPKPEETPKSTPKAAAAPKPTATPKPTPVSMTPEKMRELYKQRNISATGREPKPNSSKPGATSSSASSASGGSAGKPGAMVTRPGGTGNGRGTGTGTGSGNGSNPGSGSGSGSTATGKGMSLKSAGLPLYYSQGALQHVSRFFTVPEAQQQSVSAVLEFRILRNGTITDIRLKRSCGVPALDQRALEALRAAKKFSPLPDSVTDDSIRHEMTFSMRQ
ncbi:MAG: TonB family protein [Candidatus Sumerlaeia bacterium]|nr:TonB family protein [Candidatus Sumerlaeia bacterium]